MAKKKGRKKAARRKGTKRKAKGQVPLKILEKRLKKLNGIVRSRGGKSPCK